MSYRIPEEKIAEVKNACDIVDIVSESVVLKKTGRNFSGLCPFHAEKTPSFTVSPDKQIFHCFGCGEGGNVFSFLMKQNGVGFPEAVKLLALKYGIDLPVRQYGGNERRGPSEREQLIAVNRKALKFFRRALLEAGSGRKAMNYLKDRDLDEATIDRFQLAYAPRGWELLTSHLRKKGVSVDILEKSGLAVQRKQGHGHYDRFRDRIIFPITDLSGNILGFGGRVMDDALPKYLNSPETPLYNKRRTLYALKEARQDCRSTQTVYIVEGYFDAIALHRHGVCNAVATLGTALTPEQVRLVKGFIGKAGTAVLVYDSDAAGIKAAQRSIDIFNREFVDARILVLPEGHDPDSFITALGRERFLEEAGQAKGMTAFLVDTAIGHHGLSPEGKIRILAEIAPALAAVQDPVDRGLIVRDVADQLQVDESAVIEKLRRIGSSSSEAQQAAAAVGPGGDATQRLDRTEAKIVSMMLQFSEIIEDIRDQDAVSCLCSPVLRQIGEELLDRAALGPVDVSELISSCSDPEKRKLITTLAMANEAWNREGCLKLLSRFVENTKNRRILADLDQRIRDAEKGNDENTLIRLLAERQKLAVHIDRGKRGLQQRS